MKRSEKIVNKLIAEILKEYVILEKEEAPANPFAAAGADAGGGGDAGGGEEAAADAGAEDAGGDEKDKEEEDKKAKEQEQGLTFKFDVSGAKKYNTAHFRNSTAVAKKITKNGILATVQPDGVDILIGFDDITENVNRFFRKKK